MSLETIYYQLLLRMGRIISGIKGKIILANTVGTKSIILNKFMTNVNHYIPNIKMTSMIFCVNGVLFVLKTITRLK